MSAFNQELFNALTSKMITPKEVRTVLNTFLNLKAMGVIVYIPTKVSELVESATKALYPMTSDEPQRKALAQTLDTFLVKNPAIEEDNNWVNKIQIIKSLREAYGLGLADAKTLCEKLYPYAEQARQNYYANQDLSSDRRIPVEMKARMQNLSERKEIPYTSLIIFVNEAGTDLDFSKRIQRIKAAREKYNFGLADAKEFVETIWWPHG